MAVVTFRTDAAVDSALEALMSRELDRSEAIRQAILTAYRLRVAEEVRREALDVADDPEDRAEARAVLAEMDSLRAR